MANASSAKGNPASKRMTNPNYNLKAKGQHPKQLRSINLPKPIRVKELSTACDQMGIPFNSIIKTLHHLPYWRYSLVVDVHEFKKQ